MFASFNLAVFNLMYNIGLRGTIFDAPAVFFAEYLPYFLVLGFLFLVWNRQGRRAKLYLFFEGALAVILARGIITEIIQFFYYHPRPFDALGFAPLIAESGTSFPSGHMAWFFALAMIVWYADKKWGTWFFVLSFLMGIARVYAGVHWPLDIVGGIVIGIVSGIFIHWLLGSSREKLREASGNSF